MSAGHVGAKGLIVDITNQSIEHAWEQWVPRYLVPIDPKRMGHYFTDVLIIGGGLAGLRAAHEIDPSLRTMILTKDKVQESNSAYAQGGIASVWDPEDRFDNHIQDTLVAGGDYRQNIPTQGLSATLSQCGQVQGFIP